MVVSVAAGSVLALSGHLDARSATEVRAALHAAIDAGEGDLIVDASGVDLVDATGLGVLLGAHRRAAKAGRRIVLRDSSPRLVRMLRLARLHRVFDIPSPRQAS
jgi:anti-sigma B factor antagonist